MISSSPMAAHYQSAKKNFLDEIAKISYDFQKRLPIDLFSREGDPNERRRFCFHFGDGTRVANEYIVTKKDLDWIESSISRQVMRKEKILRYKSKSTADQLIRNFEDFSRASKRLRDLITSDAPIKATSYPGKDGYRRINNHLARNNIDPKHLSDQIFIENYLSHILRQKNGFLKPGSALTTLEQLYNHLDALVGKDRNEMGRTLSFIARRGAGLSASSRDKITLSYWLRRLDEFSESSDPIIASNLILGHAYSYQHGFGYLCSAPQNLLIDISEIMGPAISAMPQEIRPNCKHSLIFHSATIAIEKGYTLEYIPLEFYNTKLSKHSVAMIFRTAIEDSIENENSDGMCWMTARLVREILPVGVPNIGEISELVGEVSKKISYDADTEWNSTRLHFEAAKIAIKSNQPNRYSSQQKNNCIGALRKIGHHKEADWLTFRT